MILLEFSVLELYYCLVFGVGKIRIGLFALLVVGGGSGGEKGEVGKRNQQNGMKCMKMFGYVRTFVYGSPDAIPRMG